MGLLSLRFGPLLVQSHVASPPLLTNPSPYSVNRKTPRGPMNSRSPRKGASVRLGCASALGVVSRRRGTPRHYGRIDRADGHPAPPRLSPIPPRHSSRFSIHRRIPQGNREYHLVPGCACRSTYGPNPTAARFWVSTNSEPIHSWMVFAKACALFHRRLKSRSQARCLSVNRDAADGEIPIA